MLYRDFAPTGFDCKGLGLEDRQDWIVAPVSQNRDSEALDKSNFAAALEILGGESDDVEVHRFGHWACGWFEIILVHPQLAAKVEDIRASLENYPVLDEEDLVRRELEEQEEAMKWEYRHYVSDDAPEDWPSAVARELDDMGSVTGDDVKLALFVLGWLDDEHVYFVERDGAGGVGKFVREDDAVEHAERLWHKGLGKCGVRVVKGGETLYTGGELR